MTGFVAFVVVMAALLALGVWWTNRRNRSASQTTMKAAGDMIRPAMRLWAGHSPYSDSNLSRLHLEAAYLAALGEEEHAAAWAQEAFRKHEQAFDENPAAWNEIAAELLASEPRPSDEARQKFAEALLTVIDLRLLMKWMDEDRDMDDPAVVEQCQGEKEVMHTVFANVAEETK